ncbi:ROK family protein [Massilia sp. 9096]|uniref:ROK family protein n=1 Tax=Massilia sp. 9096 TaxID=1500894 RepID=UPI000692464C|nr:ROK family protein [Massilia sp. 9096]
MAGLPLHLQNEANVSALAEFEFTGQAGTDPLVYLSIGYGVGAGVIVGDNLLTGQKGFAGKVGHAILQANGPLCSCGRRGCADALIGLGSLLGTEKPSHTALDQLFEKVAQGHPQTCAAVTVAGEQLGILLNNLWAAFDPMAIVIGGPAVRLGDTLIAPARRVLGEYADAAMLTAPEIRTSRFGADVVAVGGAALARHRLTRPLDLQSMARRGDKAGRLERATGCCRSFRACSRDMQGPRCVRSSLVGWHTNS